MKTRLAFGLRDQKGELWYSSEHWLEGFNFDQFPPVGLQMRFDTPLRDDEGRWSKCSDGSYNIDGGDPVRAKVESVNAHVCSDTQECITFMNVDLEVEEGELETFQWHKDSEKKKVEELIEFHTHLLRLRNAGGIKVSHSDSGFTQLQSYFLQGKMCESLADVANISINSFHESEMDMVESIEKVLREKWGLMFCTGSGWLHWHGPLMKPTQKRKRRRAKLA